MKKTRILSEFGKGYSIGSIASHVGEDKETVREFLRSRGFVLAGRDAGDKPKSHYAGGGR